MDETVVETPRRKNPLTLRDAMAELESVNNVFRRRKRNGYVLASDCGLKSRKQKKARKKKRWGSGGGKLVGSYSRNASNQSRKW